MKYLLAAAAFLALNFYVYYFLATEQVLPARKSFDVFPNQLESWICSQREVMPPKIIAVLGVSDYLLCTYQKKSGGPDSVSVYVGYHATQVRKAGGGGAETGIHPPKHCLPGSGWDIIESGIVELELPSLGEGRRPVNRLIIAKGNQRQLVYYWYHSRGHIIARDWEKLIRLFSDRLARNRTDGSLVRFMIPMQPNQDQKAERAFQDMANQVVPLLSDYVPD